MAKIPAVYEGALGRRPDAQAPRGIVSYRPQVAPDDGQAIAQAGQQITASASKALGKIVAEKQNNELKQAQIDFSARKMEILHGDGQKQGYTGLQGQDALDNFAETQEALNKARAETLGNLSGPVSETFDLWSQAESLRATSTMRGHVNQQRVVVQDRQSSAFIAQMQNEIVANPNDAGLVRSKRVEILRETLEMAERKGIKDENAISDLVRKNWTEAHKQAIARLLEDSPVEAKAYLEAHRGDIDPMQIGAIEKTVRAGTITREAQDAADIAAERFDNVDDALAWVRKKYEGKEEEAAVRETKERYQERENALARADRERAREERDALAKGQEAADEVLAQEGVSESAALAKVAEDYQGQVRKRAEAQIRAHFGTIERERNRVDRDLRASAYRKAQEGQMPNAAEQEAINKQLGLSERLDKIRENTARGLPQVSDEQTRRELIMMRKDAPLAFAKADLYGEQYGGRLSGSDLEQFEKWQISVDKNDAQAKRLDRARRIAAPLLKSAGFKVGTKDDNTADFQLALAERLDQLPGDKPVTDKEIQEIALGLLLQGEDIGGGMFSDPDIRGFQAGKSFSAKDFAKENEAAIDALARRSGVAPERTTVIVQALVQQGRPTTAETIRQIDAALRSKGK